MGILKEMQRAHARQVRAQKQAQAAAHRHHQQLRRDAERALNAAQRTAVANERERKRLYVEARLAEVAADNCDRSRLVRRVLPLLGFIGALLLVASFTAVLFDVWGRTSAQSRLAHFRSHCGSSHRACG
ncbi:hypothetical protein [Micromonospora sp. NBC_00421]|uniref:hypothetical protein n=1 Tax=Micromonospora sp. NBC_00421 TaxID=2975976 RepID=UPI002E210450